MADYENTNSGALFANADKRSEKAPDYTGTMNFEGKEVRLAGWIRESKTGKKFLSIKVDDFKKKEKAVQPIAEDVVLGDEIPF